MLDLSRWRVGRIVRTVARRAGDDGGGQLVDALTYHAFLSLFPVLLLALSVIGFVLSGNPSEEREWVNRLSASVPGLGPLIERNLQAIVEGRAGAGVVALVGLAWTGLGTVKAARVALARIFRRPRPGNFLRRELASLATLAGLGVVALVSLTATGVLAGVGDRDGVGLAFRVLGIAAATGVDLAFFLLVYRALTPGPGPSFRDLVPAALVMAAGWMVLKIAGTWYGVWAVARASAVYGTFGAVVGILAILSIAARLFVYGAELSAVIAEERREARAP